MMQQAYKVELFKNKQMPANSLHAKYSTKTGLAVVGDYEVGHLHVVIKIKCCDIDEYLIYIVGTLAVGCHEFVFARVGTNDREWTSDYFYHGRSGLCSEFVS
jgi:hypothetical protein